MPFTRPSLKEIDDRIQADISFRMGGKASYLKRAFVKVFGRVLAGAMHLLYGFMEWAFKQFFAATAEREAILEKGKVYGLTLKPAEYAQGFIRVSGTAGAIVSVGTIFKRADGFRYEVDAPLTISGAFGDVHVKALELGSVGNLSAGEPVSLESPITGVLTDAVVSPNPTPGAIAGGINEEDIEAFRARYLLRTQNPPQGGSKADYKSWAMEVAGVGDAFVYAPREIKGSVDRPLSPGDSITPPIGSVYVYVKSTDPANPEPSVGIVNDVQAYLETKKTATATVKVFGVTAKVVNFNVSLHLTNGFSQNDAEDEISAELNDLFYRVGYPFATVRLSQIDEAISNAAAEDYHVTATPSADIELAYNEIAKVGTLNVTLI